MTPVILETFTAAEAPRSWFAQNKDLLEGVSFALTLLAVFRKHVAHLFRSCFGWLFADKLAIQSQHAQRLDNHQTRIKTLEDADELRRQSLEQERASHERLTQSTRNLADQFDSFGVRVEKMSDAMDARMASLGDHVMTLTQSVGVLQGRAEGSTVVPERRDSARRHEGRRGPDHKRDADVEPTVIAAAPTPRKRSSRRPPKAE